jgi:glycogen debranching enzyme
LFRELAYEPSRIRDAVPFALQPVLFNSLLVGSNRDLAEIARALGSDPEPFEAWAQHTAAGLETLWDDEQALYVDYDVIADRRVGVGTAAGLAPLYAGVPDDDRARRMIERLAGSRVTVGVGGWAVTSLSPEDPGFQPTRYWRGPVWPILNWVLQRGLERYGYGDGAEQVRRAVVELGRREGFWEHYDPLTGHGHGGEQFAWTAALVLDLLQDGRPARTEAEMGH